MATNIDPAARPNPLYLKVARALREEVVSGAWPVGSQLPTEEALSERFSVSRNTIREALRRLREDGLVASRQGAGTIVVPPPLSDSHVHHATSINDLVAFGVAHSLAFDSIRMVAIDDELASRTGLARDEEWLQVRGFRQSGDDGPPASWTEYYIHRDFAAIGRLLQRHTGPIFPLIEDMFGQRIVEVDQEITATLVSPALAAGLKVDAGSPALAIRRIFRTGDGQIAQVTINTHPAARFSHSMTLRRGKA